MEISILAQNAALKHRMLSQITIKFIGGPMTHLHRELIGYAVLALLALATIFLAGERGMEAASYLEQVTALRREVEALKGRPLVQSKYTTVNYFRGLAEVKTGRE